MKLPTRITARAFLSYLGRLRGGIDEGEIDHLAERMGLEHFAQANQKAYLRRMNRTHAAFVRMESSVPELVESTPR